MAVSLGKTEARKMAQALEPEYSGWTAELKALNKKAKAGDADPLDMAEIERLTDLIAGVEEFGAVALSEAQDIIASKAKFTVVAQVKEKGDVGDKVALGWYSTEKQAITDALAMTVSNLTHEESKAWVLPLHNGSPHEWYKARKAEMQTEEGLEYRKAEIKRRAAWLDANPEDPIPLDWTIEVVTKIDTNECEACYGLGRIPHEDIKRRDSVPQQLRSPRAVHVSA